MRPKGRLSRFLLNVLGFCAGVLLSAATGDYPLYRLPTLLALGLIVRALEPLARKRGWGTEGRLTRYLIRSRLVDESKRLRLDPRAR